MAASTTSADQFTQEQVQRVLIKPLEQASVFLAAGPRVAAKLDQAFSAGPAPSRCILG